MKQLTDILKEPATQKRLEKTLTLVTGVGGTLAGLSGFGLAIYSAGIKHNYTEAIFITACSTYILSRGISGFAEYMGIRRSEDIVTSL